MNQSCVAAKRDVQRSALSVVRCRCCGSGLLGHSWAYRTKRTAKHGRAEAGVRVARGRLFRTVQRVFGASVLPGNRRVHGQRGMQGTAALCRQLPVRNGCEKVFGGMLPT